MQSSSLIITTNKSTPNFLQAGCSSGSPTNSVTAPKGVSVDDSHDNSRKNGHCTMSENNATSQTLGAARRDGGDCLNK